MDLAFPCPVALRLVARFPTQRGAISLPLNCFERLGLLFYCWVVIPSKNNLSHLASSDFTISWYVDNRPRNWLWPEQKTENKKTKKKTKWNIHWRCSRWWPTDNTGFTPYIYIYISIYISTHTGTHRHTQAHTGTRNDRNYTASQKRNFQ